MNQSDMRILKGTEKWIKSTEEEQAWIRVVFAISFASILLALKSSGWNSKSPVITQILTTSIILIPVLGLFLIRSVPEIKRPSRIFFIIHDMTATTAGMITMELYGAIYLFVFSYVSIGYGMRYNNNYLYFGVIYSLVCMAGIYILSNFWSGLSPVLLGTGVTVVIIPLYVARLNTKKNEALAAATEADRAKTNFIATMSHELRTPLTGVVAAATLLKNENLNSRSRDLLDSILSSSTTLQEQIDQILIYTKINDNKESDDLKITNPSHLLIHCMSILKEYATSKGLTLSQVINQNLPARISIRQQQLKRILINIIGNAIKFTEHGKVKVITTFEHTSNYHGKLLLEIKDTGIGISKEALQSIFEPFRQEDSSITRRYGGSGLGTTITKKLVDQMGGSISISSQKGEGTSVKISIPVTIPDFELEPDWGTGIIVNTLCQAPAWLQEARKWGGWTISEEHTQQGIAFEETESGQFVSGGHNGYSVINLNDHTPIKVNQALYNISPPDLFNTQLSHITKNSLPSRRSGRVLVADDNETNSWLIKITLEDSGYTVDCASNGFAAMEKMKNQAYDIYILDRHMPDLSGPDALRAHRKSFINDTTPAILLTADTTENASEDALDSGFCALLEKPFDPESLVTQVTNAIHKHQSLDSPNNQPTIVTTESE